MLKGGLLKAEFLLGSIATLSACSGFFNPMASPATHAKVLSLSTSLKPELAMTAGDCSLVGVVVTLDSAEPQMSLFIEPDADLVSSSLSFHQESDCSDASNKKITLSKSSGGVTVSSVGASLSGAFYLQGGMSGTAHLRFVDLQGRVSDNHFSFGVVAGAIKRQTLSILQPPIAGVCSLAIKMDFTDAAGNADATGSASSTVPTLDYGHLYAADDTYCNTPLGAATAVTGSTTFRVLTPLDATGALHLSVAATVGLEASNNLTLPVVARPVYEFHSYNIVNGNHDTSGPSGDIWENSQLWNLSYYISDASGDVTQADPSTASMSYSSAGHPEAFNELHDYWYGSTMMALQYGYFGKSTIGRGLDPQEGDVAGAPGVYDLTMHPGEVGAWTQAVDNKAVVKIQAPYAGEFTIKELGARRLDTADPGNFSDLEVYNQGDVNGGNTTIVVGADNAWHWSSDTYMESGAQGDGLFYVAVGKHDSVYWWDATEVAFTLQARPQSLFIWSCPKLQFAEGDAPLSCAVSLTAKPTSSVTIKLYLGSGVNRTSPRAMLVNSSLTFTPDNYDQPQNVIVSPQSNGVAESPELLNVFMDVPVTDDVIIKEQGDIEGSPLTVAD